MSALASGVFRSWRRVLAVCVVTVAAAGCDAVHDPVASAPDGRVASSLAAAPETAQRTAEEFARVLAVALKEPGMRGVLHQAMRDSRFNEHKLVLQTFLATPAGGRMVDAMAAAGGVNEATVREWAAQLPPMDFYVPFPEHRRAWTGAGDVVVGANMDVDDPRFTGYTPEGSAVQLDARDGAPRQVVVFLHPAEPKGTRRSSGPARGNGRTIEDPSEPVSSVLMLDDESCAGPEALLPCSTGGTGGGGYSTGPATYTATLHTFKNYKGDGVGGIELVVKHYAGNAQGTRIDEQLLGEALHWDWVGFYYAWDDVTTPLRPIKFAQNTSTYIKVYERDSGAEGWFGGDDYWGEGLFGGFGVGHRFRSTRTVEYLYDNSCRPVDGCGTSATVDIYYDQ